MIGRVDKLLLLSYQPSDECNHFPLGEHYPTHVYASWNMVTRCYVYSYSICFSCKITPCLYSANTWKEAWTRKWHEEYYTAIFSRAIPSPQAKITYWYSVRDSITLRADSYTQEERRHRSFCYVWSDLWSFQYSQNYSRCICSLFMVNTSWSYRTASCCFSHTSSTFLQH